MNQRYSLAPLIIAVLVAIVGLRLLAYAVNSSDVRQAEIALENEKLDFLHLNGFSLPITKRERPGIAKQVEERLTELKAEAAKADEEYRSYQKSLQNRHTAPDPNEQMVEQELSLKSASAYSRLRFTSQIDEKFGLLPQLRP